MSELEEKSPSEQAASQDDRKTRLQDMQKAVDQIDALIAYWDENRICAFANDAYREWFGETKEEMIGIRIEEFLGSLYEKSLPYIQAAYAGRKQIFERDIPTPGGIIRRALISYTPDIFEGKVRGISVLGVPIDVPRSAVPTTDAPVMQAAAAISQDSVAGPSKIIGVLEDDTDQSYLLSVILKAAGYGVYLFVSLADFRARDADVARCDLMILDWSLSDGTAFEVLKAAPHTSERKVPLIMLTARATEEDVARGMDAGADDYVTKPVRPAELTARIRAALRRFENASDELADCPPYNFDAAREQISLLGVPVKLTAREFAIAIYLFKRQGQAVMRTAIQRDVLKLSPRVLTRSLDTHISRLRRKLHLNGEHGFELVSIYQTGYRLKRR